MVRSAVSAVCFSWLFSNSRSAKQLALRRQPPLQIVDAGAEHLGFLDLRDQLPVEIGDALAQIFDLAAGLAELARGGLGFGLLLVSFACVVENSFSASLTRLFSSSIWVRTATSST